MRKNELGRLECLEKEIKLLKKKNIKMEQELNAVKLEFDLCYNRSLMYQKMISRYITETYYEKNKQNLSVNEIMSLYPSVMMNKDYRSLLDDRSRLDEFLSRCFGVKVQQFKHRTENLEFDVAMLFGIKDIYENSRLMLSALERNKQILFVENGFISSIVPDVKNDVPMEYRLIHSMVFDTKGMYFDARHESDLELMLNSDRKLTSDEMQRAYALIKNIVNNKISKYNHQPICDVYIGHKPKKVLVVDQVWGDASIYYGMADENVFSEMLLAARRENPDADIIVKTHPDTNDTMKRRHYDFKKETDLYVVDYDLNPYSLLEIVDKVYVCTSQMGFEALMAGKEVHCFGMPFYAGWGITVDTFSCVRRSRKRSLEEIFYFFYINYTYYVSYLSNNLCEIEQVIDELVALRKKYWKEKKR